MEKPTILIVDDEVFFRRMFSDVLAEDDSYQIETVGSGKEAMERLSQGGVDVVLTDMVMPDICGLELIRRTRVFDPPPEIILATGNASVESAIQALKNGARDYLLKPCNPEQLRHTVRSCLEQRQLLAENTLLQSQVRLYRKGQHLSSQLDVDDLFKEALDILISELGHGRGLAFSSNQNGINQVTSNDGFSDDEAQALAPKLNEIVCDLQHGVRLEAKTCSQLGNDHHDLRSLWVFPLHSGQEDCAQGALAICNPPNADLPEELPHEALTFLAEQVALGFKNASQYQGARELIYTDDLTGLYNHRYLHIALEQEIRRSERYGLEFSLAFVDLDLFKEINDEHGHLVGSNVLRQVSELLRQCVRDADMLFRYGGDEFTALLIETDTRGAKIVAERIRRTIEEFAFSVGRGQTGRITTTVGHATYPIHATIKNELIDLADKAMYVGKGNRNTSVSASEANENIT